jgi:hypothetical protein
MLMNFSDMTDERRQELYDKAKQTGRFGVGRHARRYFYTLEDIARVSGRSVGTIRNSLSKGLFEADDLESVIRFVVSRRGESSLCDQVGEAG